jgi:hypothetical protein
MPPRPTTTEPPPPLWRSRRLWYPVGYTATGLWMLGVLVVTGGDSRHPLFDYIFIVPLAAWLVGVLAAALVKRRFGRGNGRSLERDRRH